MMAPGYKMNRFDATAIAQQQKQTPEQYIAKVGECQARANYNCLYAGLNDKANIGKFWTQVNGILKARGV